MSRSLRLSVWFALTFIGWTRHFSCHCHDKPIRPLQAKNAKDEGVEEIEANIIKNTGKDPNQEGDKITALIKGLPAAFPIT